MKSLTIRLTDSLAADIEAESRRRGIGKSEVARERLARTAARRTKQSNLMEVVRRLAGSLNHPPSDLSSRVDDYLRKTGYGKNRRSR